MDVRQRVVAALRETETNTKLRTEHESLYAQNAGLGATYSVDSRVVVGLKQAVKALRRSSVTGAEQASAAKKQALLRHASSTRDY